MIFYIFILSTLTLLSIVCTTELGEAALQQVSKNKKCDGIEVCLKKDKNFWIRQRKGNFLVVAWAYKDTLLSIIVKDIVIKYCLND